jgi:hypothetical protein
MLLLYILSTIIVTSYSSVDPSFPTWVDCASSIIAPPNSQNNKIEGNGLVSMQWAWLDIIKQVLGGVGQEENESRDGRYCKIL